MVEVSRVRLNSSFENLGIKFGVSCVMLVVGLVGILVCMVN